MVRKGQVKRLDRGDAVGQAKFVESLFHLAAQQNSLAKLSRLKIFFATQPFDIRAILLRLRDVSKCHVYFG